MTSKRSRLVSIVLGLAGIGILLFGALADVIGVGRDPDFLGRYQFMVMVFGMVVIVVAALFLLMGTPPGGEE